MNNELRFVDVSWIPTYQDQPEDPFVALNQQTDEDDAFLQGSLGIPQLIEELSSQANHPR